MIYLIIYLAGALIVKLALTWARENYYPNFQALVFDVLVSLGWVLIVPVVLMMLLIVAVWYLLNYGEDK